MAHTDSSALLGRTVAGKFVIEAVVGVGGTGTVYRAHQLGLDRTVALKVLNRDIAGDEMFVDRFKREARAASRLDHPNSVRVLDFGTDSEGLLYLAMEYVQGRTLHQVLREEWPLADARIVDILSQVLAALSVAHEMGVIHRDLKPENVIVLRGRSDEGDSAELAKVCDFGIATVAALARDGRQTPDGSRMTLRGYVVGTPEYMSPEQVRGEAADQRSDLYSTGVVLYQMLAGRPPFSGDDPFGLAVKHATEVPPAPSTIREVNPALEAICLKAISKAPADRYASAREMRAALRAVMAPGPVEAPAPTPRPAPPPAETMLIVTPARRGRRLALLALAGAAAAAVIYLLIPEVPPPLPPEPPVAKAPPRPEPPPPPALPPPSAEPPVAPPAAPPRARPRLARGHAAPPRAAADPGPRNRDPEPAPGLPARVMLVDRQAAEPTPPAPIPPPPPPAPRPTTVDVEHAAVSVTAVATASGIPGSNVRAAVSRLPLARCYREALRTRGSPAPGTATLQLKIDASGYVTSAVLQDAQFLPAMRGCIEQAARSLRVRDVDTGEASASVTLNFVSTP